MDVLSSLKRDLRSNTPCEITSSTGKRLCYFKKWFSVVSKFATKRLRGHDNFLCLPSRYANLKNFEGKFKENNTPA